MDKGHVQARGEYTGVVGTLGRPGGRSGMIEEREGGATGN
jgi:hypothetical protein